MHSQHRIYGDKKKQQRGNIGKICEAANNHLCQLVDTLEMLKYFENSYDSKYSQYAQGTQGCQTAAATRECHFNVTHCHHEKIKQIHWLEEVSFDTKRQYFQTYFNRKNMRQDCVDRI